MLETLVIPQGSRERFLRFRDAGDADGWFSNGVELAGLSDLRPGYLVDRPSCRHHFVGYVTGGSARFGEGEAGPGDMVFLPAGSLHHYGSRRRFSMFWLHLAPRHSRWAHLAGQSGFLRPAHCLAEVEMLAGRAFSEQQSPLWRTSGVVEPLCRLILAYIDRDFEGDTAGGHDRARLEAVWREVGRDPSRRWSVPALARLAGLSTSHFHAAVGAVYRKSPMRIVRDLRIERARVLLIHTDDKLEAISALVGYESAFSFSKVFKAAVGVPPRHYREARRKRKDEG